TCRATRGSSRGGTPKQTSSSMPSGPVMTSRSSDHPAVLDHRDLQAGLRARADGLLDGRLDLRPCSFLVHATSLASAPARPQ
ncbi:MAG: hypothetical protein J2P30_28445, partial [Actinobacteria bacterium]|nr:hypothetical protein [Actinomycetota bacterium]